MGSYWTVTDDLVAEAIAAYVAIVGLVGSEEARILL